MTKQQIEDAKNTCLNTFRATETSQFTSTNPSREHSEDANFMRLYNLKTKALEWSQQFSHYKSMGFFRRASAANSAVPGRI